MKFIVLLFVQLLVVHVTWSAVYKLQDSRNADHPGKCYINSSDPPTILSPGEIVTIKGKCLRASCNSDFSVDFADCGVVAGHGEHYKPGDLSLPYPQCCPSFAAH
ncbi:hypothetical protein CBL_10081 [Carabus blaptoides fortunei]